jgi:hypothetical protein
LDLRILSQNTIIPAVVWLPDKSVAEGDDCLAMYFCIQGFIIVLNSLEDQGCPVYVRYGSAFVRFPDGNGHLQD